VYLSRLLERAGSVRLFSFRESYEGSNAIFMPTRRWRPLIWAVHNSYTEEKLLTYSLVSLGYTEKRTFLVC
jgi:hypothetical protein